MGEDIEYDEESDLLKLNSVQIKKIKKFLKDNIEKWEKNTAPLKSKLVRWSNLVDGIVEDADVPFQDAITIHVGLVSVYMDVYYSIEYRSIMGSGKLWYAETDDSQIDKVDIAEVQKIDEYFNYAAKNKWNVFDKTSEALYCANRDGLSALKFIYTVDTDHVKNDRIEVDSEQDFLDSVPQPEDVADMPEWVQYREQSKSANEKNPLEIEISYDKTVYEGPKAYLIERANLVTFPATAQSIDKEHCYGWGEKMQFQKHEIKGRMNKGEWYKDECVELMKKMKQSKSTNYFERNKLENVGIGIESSKSIDLYNIVCYMDLNEDEEDEKYVFTYSKDHNKLVEAKCFEYMVDNVALFRIKRRPNQLDGYSIPEMLEETDRELDLLHSQRFQSRQIVGVPSFVGKMDDNKNAIDMNLTENTFRVGVVYWMMNPDNFKRLDVGSIDFKSSMVEEQNIFRTAALRMGIDAFLASGRPTPDNPNAPGSKTEMLISQGNLRMESPIAELRLGIEQVGRVCLSQVYQFGKSELNFVSEQSMKGAVTKKKGIIKRKYLRNGVNLKMSAISVIINPESEFARWKMYFDFLIMEPLIQSNAKRRIDLIRRIIINGRIPGLDGSILPGDEEIAMFMKAQAEANKKMQEDQGVAKLMAMKDHNALAKRHENLSALDTIKGAHLVKDLSQKFINPPEDSANNNGGQ